MASPTSLAIAIAAERAWLQRVAGRSLLVRGERLVDVAGDDCIQSKRSSALVDAPDRTRSAQMHGRRKRALRDSRA
jgi:hypothetical protein